MRTYQRKGVWYLDYSFKGRRVRVRAGSKEEAEKALEEIKAKIAHEKLLPVSNVKGLIFDKLCGEYLVYSRANKEFQSYRRDSVSVKNLLKIFKGKTIAGISAYDLEQYKNARRKNVAPGTVNRELTCIKNMFNKAVDWEFMAENRLRRVKNFKEPPGRVRYLADDEKDKLLECSARHLKPIVIMALNTGMRKGEILKLKWSDVNLETREITVIKTKNNETKIVPINETVYQEIVRMERNGNSYVFCDKNGRPYKDVKRSFRTACKRAGIPNFRFHDCRHHYASMLVMKGVDIRTVQELMGHKDISMTVRYSHLSSVHLHEAVRKLDAAKKDKDDDKKNTSADNSLVPKSGAKDGTNKAQRQAG